MCDCLIADLTCCRELCQVTRCVLKARAACPLLQTPPAPRPACDHTRTAPPTGWWS